MRRKQDRVSPKRLLFGYAGSKAVLAPKYIAMFPKHRIYVSPFGGTAAEFAFKDKSQREIYNDLDHSVYSVFAVLRDRRKLLPELIRLLDNSHNSRRLYRECFDRLKNENLSLLDRAYCFLIAGNIGYLGRHPELAGGYSAGIKKQKVHRLIDMPDLLLQWRDRMKWVEVEHLDAFDLIDKYDDPTTFFFLDPPYHPAICAKSLYVHDHIDHRRLLERLHKLKGLAMVCGYGYGLYDVQLLGWKRVELATKKSLGGSLPRTEIVWMNYDEQGKKLRHDAKLIRDFTGLPA